VEADAEHIRLVHLTPSARVQTGPATCDGRFLRTF
jgi:hypothetical protein